MNNTLDKYARDELKAGLKKVSENMQLLFKRMYSHQNLNIDIDTVVDNMPAKKLDWAMQQVERSIVEKN